MYIRLAKQTDVDAIVLLGKQLLTMHGVFDPNYYALEDNFDELFSSWVKDHMSHPSQFILVAENGNNSIAGFISGFIKSLYPWFRVKKVGHIAYLMVHSTFQKQGIGTQLEKEALNWFKTKDINYVEVYTDMNNDIGQHAWLKFGYDDFKRFLRKKIS